MGKMWRANWKTEFYVITLSAKSIANSTEMLSMFKVKNAWHFGIKKKRSLLENTEKGIFIIFWWSSFSKFWKARKENNFSVEEVK